MHIPIYYVIYGIRYFDIIHHYHMNNNETVTYQRNVSNNFKDENYATENIINKFDNNLNNRNLCNPIINQEPKLNINKIENNSFIKSDFNTSDIKNKQGRLERNVLGVGIEIKNQKRYENYQKRYNEKLKIQRENDQILAHSKTTNSSNFCENTNCHNAPIYLQKENIENINMLKRNDNLKMKDMKCRKRRMLNETDISTKPKRVCSDICRNGTNVVYWHPEEQTNINHECSNSKLSREIK